MNKKNEKFARLVYERCEYIFVAPYTEDSTCPRCKKFSKKIYETRITCPVCRADGQDIKIVKRNRAKKISFIIVPLKPKYVCKKCGYGMWL